MRDGNTQCPAVATTGVEVDGEKVRVCSWHKRVWADYGELRPPPRERKRDSVVDPEPDEDDVPTLINGNGKTVESVRSLVLELVVSRPNPPEEPPPPPKWDEDVPDFDSMSTADLYRAAFGRKPPSVPKYDDGEDEVA
jgi:hypothetical protein